LSLKTSGFGDNSANLQSSNKDTEKSRLGQ